MREVAYRCGICAVLFTSSELTRAHIRKCHPGQKPISPAKKPEFKCDVDGCRYVGQRLTYLSQHKRKCHSTKRFTCPLCDHVLKTTDSLNKHVRGHTSPRIACPEPGCPADFMSKSSLEMHVSGRPRPRMRTMREKLRHLATAARARGDAAHASIPPAVHRVWPGLGHYFAHAPPHGDAHRGACVCVRAPRLPVREQDARCADQPPPPGP